MNKKVILVIMDGWGMTTQTDRSALAAAKTPFVTDAWNRYTHSTLAASGLPVGLPDGQMGNSEVGHMNLGAGRIVYQDLVKINLAVEQHTLQHEPVLADALARAKAGNKKVHLIGLVSDGGVHAHIDHLKGLLSIAHEQGLSKVFVHAFTDGRDTDPKSGLAYLTDLTQHMANTTGQLATVIGRFYAMDRDNRWERVKVAYDAMVNAVGDRAQGDGVFQAIRDGYEAGTTDEFISPIVMEINDHQPVAKIENGDVVICFNFRTDRGREITMALTQKDFPEQQMHRLDLDYITMTNYDSEFKGVNVIYEKDNLEKTLGEVVAEAGRKQIRIAETEKYPHVTFFFSGGREAPFAGETRLLVPSPKEMTMVNEQGETVTVPVKTYDQKPEMSAAGIRDAIVAELKKEEVDFVCLNFANTDMVGHTGVFEAVVRAAETVDATTRDVVTTGLEHGYTSIIIADHGNADYMRNDDGSSNTAHTTSLVPCILVDNDYQPALKNGKLGDMAPTILALMGIPQPPEMTGVSLLA